MEWTDDGIVVGHRRHGESSRLVTLLSREHGRHAGLVRGGGRRGNVYEIGDGVRARWRGRLAEHLGTLSLERTHSIAAELFGNVDRLAALAAACAIAETALPDREPQPRVFAALAALLATLPAGEEWPWAYVKWEVGLLAELGFGLDLGRCAASGIREDLCYVSPRTGRAVSRAAGAPYRNRLLALPSFLVPTAAGSATANDVADGLTLTGYFLRRHVYAPVGRDLPAARRRLADRFAPPVHSA